MLPFNNVVQMVFTPPGQPLQLLCNMDCTNLFSLKIGVSEVHFKPLVLTRQDLVVVNRIRKTVSEAIAGGVGGSGIERAVHIQMMLAELIALLIRKVCPDMPKVAAKDECTTVENGPAETESDLPANHNQLRWISCAMSSASSDYLPQLRLVSSDLVGDSKKNDNPSQTVLSRKCMCPCGSGKIIKKCCELKAPHLSRRRPCPCGSGEQFKKCCELEADHPKENDNLTQPVKMCSQCGNKTSRGDLDEKLLFFCAACWEFCKSLEFHVAGCEAGEGESQNFPVGVPLEKSKHRWLQCVIVRWTNVIANGIHEKAHSSVKTLRTGTKKDYKAGELPPFVTPKTSSVYPVYTCKMLTKEVLKHLEANPALEVSLRGEKGRVEAFQFRAGFSGADALKWAENNYPAVQTGDGGMGEDQSNDNCRQHVLSRNHPCPYESGKTFKTCCELEADRIDDCQKCNECGDMSLTGDLDKGDLLFYCDKCWKHCDSSAGLPDSQHALGGKFSATQNFLQDLQKESGVECRNTEGGPQWEATRTPGTYDVEAGEGGLWLEGNCAEDGGSPACTTRLLTTQYKQPPSDEYLCLACKQRGHWIRDCSKVRFTCLLRFLLCFRLHLLF